MLEMVMSLIAFLILSIKGFLGYFIFRPPNPPGYKIINDDSQSINHQKIVFYNKGKMSSYEQINFSTVVYEYTSIEDSTNRVKGSFIPIIIIRPHNHLKCCLIYSHGNSGDIGTSFLECVDIALSTYCCVICYEYPGYGNCKKMKLTEEGICHNISMVYQYAINSLRFQSSEIILYGYSLGTGPTIELAVMKKSQVAAIILQAPFLSILRNVTKFKSTPFYDYFPNLDKAHLIQCPVLILHGTKDRVVPFRDGRKLSRMIKKELLFDFFKIEGGDHNNILKNHKEIAFRKIRDFLSIVTHIPFDNMSSKIDESHMMSYNSKKIQHKEEDQLKEMNIKQLVESEINNDILHTEHNRKGDIVVDVNSPN